MIDLDVIGHMRRTYPAMIMYDIANVQPLSDEKMREAVFILFYYNYNWTGVYTVDDRIRKYLVDRDWIGLYVELKNNLFYSCPKRKEFLENSVRRHKKSKNTKDIFMKICSDLLGYLLETGANVPKCPKPYYGLKKEK